MSAPDMPISKLRSVAKFGAFKNGQSTTNTMELPLVLFTTLVLNFVHFVLLRWLVRRIFGGITMVHSSISSGEAGLILGTSTLIAKQKLHFKQEKRWFPTDLFDQFSNVWVINPT